MRLMIPAPNATQEGDGAGCCLTPGFAGAAAATGVKGGDALDLALVASGRPATAAAVFTTNPAVAAPVEVSRLRLERSRTVDAVVINAGNANALTGPAGLADAEAMALRTEQSVSGRALVLSTGVIGVPLPIEPILAGIDDCAGRLSDDPAAGDEVARAMLTTDTRCKQASVRLELPDRSGARTITVAGTAKGSGMIHPQMATMLALITTDAAVEPQALQQLLERSVDRSFHQITIDGDTSTNDAVVLLANGASGASPLTADDDRLPLLQEAVDAVAARLAEQIVEDGEGMTRVIELRIAGAAHDAAARALGRAVASSALVKTAFHGGDPNWGRILAAAGQAQPDLDLGSVRLAFGPDQIEVFADGAPVPHDLAAVEAAFAQPRVELDLHVGAGIGRARVLTTDLSARYVEINASYRT